MVGEAGGGSDIGCYDIFEAVEGVCKLHIFSILLELDAHSGGQVFYSRRKFTFIWLGLGATPTAESNMKVIFPLKKHESCNCLSIKQSTVVHSTTPLQKEDGKRSLLISLKDRGLLQCTIISYMELALRLYASEWIYTNTEPDMHQQTILWIKIYYTLRQSTPPML
jgi:hypothetical protein